MKNKTLLLFFIFISCISFGQTRPHWNQIVERPYSDVVDITQFGAIADTDTVVARAANIAAFNAAVLTLRNARADSANLYETKAHMGTLYIPAGNWYFTDVASISDVRGINIVGAGKHSTIIQSTANPILRLEGSVATGHMAYGQCVVQDIGFANPAELASGIRSFDPTQVGIYAKTTFGNVWSNLEFNNIGQAIYLDTSYFNTIMGCMFRLGVGVSGTGANNNQITGCWFADSVFDLSGVSYSSVSKCDVESGGFAESDGPVVGNDCQVFNNRFERVNINAPMPYLNVVGDRSSIYDNTFHLTVTTIDSLTQEAPVIKISGNNNRIRIPYMSFVRRMVTLDDSAINNTIEFENPLVGGGQSYTILKTLPYYEIDRAANSAKNAFVYSSTPGEAKTTLRNLTQESTGIFTELGSSNNQLATNTFWFAQTCTVAALDPASFPVGWDATIASFAVIAANASSSTVLKRWYMNTDKTVADNQPVTAIALIKNNSNVGAHFGAQLARGEYIPPNSDWQWYVTRAVGNGSGNIRVTVTLADNLTSDYWTVATQTLYIGAISLVEGEIPSYVGSTGATSAYFIGGSYP